jgi:anti-sigma factor RsiW
MINKHVLVQNDLAAYALDALDASDRPRLQAHLDCCCDCVTLLAEFRAAASHLPLELEPHPLPPDSWEVLLARVRHTRVQRCRSAVNRVKRWFSGRLRHIQRMAMGAGVAALTLGAVCAGLMLKPEGTAPKAVTPHKGKQPALSTASAPYGMQGLINQQALRPMPRSADVGFRAAVGTMSNMDAASEVELYLVAGSNVLDVKVNDLSVLAGSFDVIIDGRLVLKRRYDDDGTVWLHTPGSVVQSVPVKAEVMDGSLVTIRTHDGAVEMAGRFEAWRRIDMRPLPVHQGTAPSICCR